MQELSKPDYFNRQIDQAYVLICSPSTHVPLEEFRRDEAAALYGFTFAGEEMESLRVAYTIQPQLESVELYAIPRDVEETILQFYPTARFFASRAMLMERLLHFDEDAGTSCRRNAALCTVFLIVSALVSILRIFDHGAGEAAGYIGAAAFRAYRRVDRHACVKHLAALFRRRSLFQRI